jgi:two-component system, OmpR family, response regulator
MSLKIFHVEDDLDIQEIAKLSLEALGGFTVHQCASGKQALDEVEGFGPDLFLLDVMMPEMSGDTLYTKLKAIPGLKNTPAIFMTARAQAENIAYLKELGALDVILKPFDAMDLPEKIKAILTANS